MSYSIRRIPEVPDVIADEIREMHLLAFGEELGKDYDPEHVGDWWLGYHDKTEPVAFAALVPSKVVKGHAFLMRSGVLSAHRGHNLQFRLIGVRERWARRCGYTGLVSYTIDNPHSANNLIRAGMKTYDPPWRFTGNPETIYFKKDF